MIFLASCKYKTQEAIFFDYINDPKNKITQKIQIGDTHITAKWMSEAYRKLLRQGKDNYDISKEDESYYYFNVKFEKLTDEKPTKEKLLYLDFDIQQDFKLLVNADSILPSMCQKIENGLNSSYEYLVAFEKPRSEQQDFSLIYTDKIFGIGILAFIYSTKDLLRIPTPKANKS